MHTSAWTLTVVLGMATLITTVFHRFRLPPMVGFLFAGVLVGPSALGVVASIPDVEVIVEIGAVLLMFSIGLEFDLRRILSLRRVLVNAGLAQVVLSVIVSVVFAKGVLGFSFATAYVFGAVVAMTSTAALLKQLSDHRHMETPFGHGALAITIAQDVAAIPLIMIMPLLAPGAAESLSNLDTFSVLGRTFLALGTLWVGVRWLTPLLLRLVSTTSSREVLFFSVLFLCSGVAFVMHQLGLSYSLGAFFAGVMLAESPYARQVSVDFTPLRDNFLGIFFLSMGMLLDLSFLREHVADVFGLLIMVLVGKCLVLAALLWLLGNPASVTLPISLILSQIGEFSFVIASEGKRQGLLSEEHNQIILAGTILSLALSPLLYRIGTSFGIVHKVDQFFPKVVQRVAEQFRDRLVRGSVRVNMRDLSEKKDPIDKDHIVIIGFGLAGQNLAGALRALGLTYRVVELNPNTVLSFHGGRQPIIYGDATRQEILREVGVAQARLVVITVIGAEIAAAVHEAVREVNANVPVLVRAQYVRDVDRMSKSPWTVAVVAEVEGALELMSQSLTACGLDRASVLEMTEAARQRLRQA